MEATVGVSKQEAVQAVVDEVMRRLSPDIVRIRFNFGEDWSGGDGVYVRVLLSNEASRDENRHRVASEVRDIFQARLAFANFGHLYIRFRSLEEQQELKDSIWA